MDFEYRTYDLYEIERISGLSSQELTEWFDPSPSNINRIKNLLRLVLRLQAIHGNDQPTIRRAILNKPKNSLSAMDLILEDDYQRAATAAQYAIRPKSEIRPSHGDLFMDSPMVAVEDI